MLSDDVANVWRAAFDLWRANYDLWPYKSHIAFYDMVGEFFPHQAKADYGMVKQALTEVVVSVAHPIKVYELGGWDGALAQEMFSSCQFGIRSWTNFEVCQSAVDNGFSHYFYHPIVPETWAWETPFNERCDIAILSHVIEHLSWTHLQALLTRLTEIGIPYLYIQTPQAMGEDPMNWMGTMSTHKLEVGWHAVNAFLDNIGFVNTWTAGQDRFYQHRSAHGAKSMDKLQH